MFTTREAARIGDRRTRVAALSGHIVEWYEFSAYGLLAAYLANTLFPSTDSATSLALTWATFAVAFVVRPVGGIVLGRLADRAGRRTALLTTIVLMSAATAGIGLTPATEAIGAWALVLFIGLRMVQGFAVGGEMPSAVPYYNEALPDDHTLSRRISLLAVGPWIASLGAAIIASWLSGALSAQDMDSWGWRIPFLLGLPLGLIALVLRWSAPESTVFERLVVDAERSQHPVREAFRTAWRPILAFGALALAFNVCIGVCLTGLPSEALLAGLPREDALRVSAVSYVAFIVFILAVPRLTVEWSRTRLVVAGGTCALVVVTPAVTLARSGEFASTVLACVLMGLPVGVLAVPAYRAMSDLFPARIRASAGGIAFNAATALSSLVASTTLLFRTAFGLTEGLFIWVVLASSIALAAALLPGRHLERVVG